MSESFRQLSSHRAACKLASVLIVIALLVIGVLTRANTISLLWMASPLVLLGLAEAGYAARQSYLVEKAKPGKPAEQWIELPPEPGMAGVGRFIGALASFSIWPFYLALWGTFAASAFKLPHVVTASQNPAASEIDGRAVGQPATPSGYNNLPGYPPGVLPRFPNGSPYTGPIPGYPGVSPRTPIPAFPRPATPVSFGPKPPARPLSTPTLLMTTPPAPPASTPHPAVVPAATPPK